ncbi:hypothetical protein G4B88_013192 [Cannabis sativa]|uniref:Uncharacterized protein n=1 Tax=Cannabis sativa TaxID=3483 RepID=A0A7J6GZS9_CANSA|nr:hypothetical protein G4B88_013192 [Cannabis sativa]
MRRSAPSIPRITSIQRIHSRQVHAPLPATPIIESHNEIPTFGSFRKWISGILAGSGLGFLYWSSSSTDSAFDFFNLSSMAFADCSTVNSDSEVTLQNHSPRSLLQKLSLPAHSASYIFGEAYRRRVFFNYEKRIRLRSPPEKVFEYFASCRTSEGEILMKPADLMRAVVPVFPPSESHLVRDGYLMGERSSGDIRCDPSELFMLFDVNNDGHISFKEYIFFVTLLSLPESSFSVAFKMFDINNNGNDEIIAKPEPADLAREIDKDEFKKVMALMRAQNRQGAHHRDGLRFGLKSNAFCKSPDLLPMEIEWNEPLVLGTADDLGYWKEKELSLEIPKLVQKILRLEFDHYDYKQRGTISAKDFALSMVASADMSHLKKLLDEADKLNDVPHLRDMRISLEEFKSFAELRKKLQPFSLALFSYGKVNGFLTREDFQRAAFHVCGIDLTSNVVEIIFHLFDANHDGCLSLDEFVKVLHRREREIAQPVQSGLMGFLSCCANCTHHNSMSSVSPRVPMFLLMKKELEPQKAGNANSKQSKPVNEAPKLSMRTLQSSLTCLKSLKKKQYGCLLYANGSGEYPRAINECNLALEVSQDTVKLSLEILEEVKKVMSEKGIAIDEKEIGVAIVEQSSSSRLHKASSVKDKQVITKTIVEEAKVAKKPIKEEKKVVTKTVKLVLGEDIRWAQLPSNCSMKSVREIVKDRFPGLKGVLVKYKDQEGDLVTITTTDELRLAESSDNLQGISDEELEDSTKSSIGFENGDIGKDKDVEKGVTCVEDWILQFARLFKNHVGFDSDSYLDLHELGLKLHSEAMEDTVTSDDAQEVFNIAADKFQEMTALALFNWGNVHMSKARKRVTYAEDASRDQIVEQIKVAYDWARKEYMKAEKKYEEAVKMKPDFYEGYLALGQQQFEQAKLCWYYSVGSNVELETEPSSEVLQLYNKAEDSMERGMLMWEEMEEQRLNELSKADKYKAQLQKMGLDGFVKDVVPDVAAEQAANMKSQIYLLWGTLLYERSVVEYKLGLPTWEECLEVSVEKFELAGASPTDIAVMIKNHCSNENALEGLGFKIDEIVQAWNEMYDAQRWQFGAPSFRLEPLFRRRLPNKFFSFFVAQLLEATKLHVKIGLFILWTVVSIVCCGSKDLLSVDFDSETWVIGFFFLLRFSFWGQSDFFHNLIIV